MPRVRITFSILENIAKKHRRIKSVEDLKEYNAYHFRRIVDETIEECIGVKTCIWGRGTLLKDNLLIYVRKNGKYHFKEIL